MKHLIILALLLCSIGVKAQNTIPADSIVTVKLKQSQLVTNQALLKYLYDNIRKSTVPAIEAEQVRASVEQLFPALIVDKPKEVKTKKP